MSRRAINNYLERLEKEKKIKCTILIDSSSTNISSITVVYPSIGGHTMYDLSLIKLIRSMDRDTWNGNVLMMLEE